MTSDFEETPKAPPPEFLSWLESVEGEPAAAPQHAFDVLLAEHYMMEGVLRAMEIEAQSLRDGEPLRPQFWSEVVDFVGNFIHLVHRPKEEQLIFPLVAQRHAAATEEISAFSDDHRLAEQLTLGVCAAVGDGDWERVLKDVLLYVEVIRSHLHREEVQLLRPLRELLSEEDVTRLAEQSADMETQAMRDRDRQHYLSVVRKVCAEVGLDWPLGNGVGEK